MKNLLSIRTMCFLSTLTTFAALSHETNAASAAPKTIEVSGMQRSVNVMKGVAPPKPTFTKLAVKAGTVRGFVKDWKGKPLQGAVIGVRSTAIGGFYSGASAKSDARGYYEVRVPRGAGSFYCAGYAVNWGDEGRAALGLAPADGEADEFATTKGAVENWILLPYGIADRDGVSESPHHASNYFGGTFSVYTSLAEDANSTYELPLGATYELTLTPIGNLFGGGKGQTFIVRRKLDSYNSLIYVNNIPLGRYKLGAKLIHNGQKSTLKIKETGPYSNNSFGLEPKEVRGETTLTLRPYNATANTATPAQGHWGSLDITLYR